MKLYYNISVKIDLQSLDTKNFKLKEDLLNGNVVYLINPVEFDCKWTSENLHLRSVLVDIDGNILSRGLNKFFNVGEKPDLYPNPEKYNDWVLTSKEDGSLMICDWIFENLNVRTRGTISYKNHENTSDFDYVIEKYKLKQLVEKYSDYSILFEIYSPTNIIVIKKYEEPEIILLGIVNKETGIYLPFYNPTGRTIELEYGIKTPEMYKLSGNISELVDIIKKWEGREGVVLNYNKSQNYLKLKSDWYLIRHRMKSELSSCEKVIDLWISLGYPNYIDFYNEVIKSFDYEIANIARGHISNICEGYKEVLKIIARMKSFVEPLKKLSRKDAALKILASYGETNRKSFCFQLLDSREIDDEGIKKLLFQVLKK